eukprot:Phypoly_transcript_01518.p1 GENE.Phypoly_transcript_01518~~Phypoly_transcript_01518.p1  ORF type:complete len:700 (+),score=42.08 Phypoly_transcript_01518:116-2215(+)
MYSRLLALLVVVLALGCIRAQQPLASCITITQSGFQYYWDVNKVNVQMAAGAATCLEVSASDVTISGGAVVNIRSQTVPGGALPPVAILVTGNRVTFDLDFYLTNAVVNVTGSNVTFASLTFAGPTTGNYDSVTILSATNVNGLKVASLSANNWGANIDLTGVHVQTSSDITIGGGSFVGGSGNNLDAYIYKFENSHNINVIGGGGTMIGGRVGGIVIATSTNVKLAYQSVATCMGSESGVLLSIDSSTDVSAQFSSSDEPIGIVNTGVGVLRTCGVSVVNSTGVTVGGIIKSVTTSYGAAYGVYIAASQYVTVSGLTLDDVSSSNDNYTYGVYVENSTNTLIANTAISTTQTSAHTVWGIYLRQGFGIVENNTLTLEPPIIAATTVGILFEDTDDLNIAFANNTIIADTFITAQVQAIQSLCTSVDTTPATCFPTGHYPCCPANCIPTPDNSKVCRPNVTYCDLEDHCTTNTVWCEENKYRPSTTDCGTHACGPPDYCAGTSSLCVPAPPPCIDSVAMKLGFCNESARECQCNSEFQFLYPNCTTRCGDYRCDKAELVNVTQHCFFDCYPWCQNTSTSTVECYPADGVCCLNNTCSFAKTSQVCNASLGGCDPAEMCTGSSPLCPANVIYANYTPCNFSHDSCNPPARCDGSSVTCPPLILSVCNGFCGDGICDPTNETCTSCGIDCKCHPKSKSIEI